MRTLLTTVSALALTVGTAQATIMDPLHGFCVVGSSTCAEVASGGNNVTTIVGAPGFTGADWGFTISPGPQGPAIFDVILAEPNNVAFGLPTITGKINGTAVSTGTSSLGAWTGGDIGALATVQTALPGGVSPVNPFDNFIGFTKSVDAGATGYNLALATFSSVTLADNMNAGLSVMDLSVSIPTGSLILGFLNDNPTPQAAWAATASSGVLWDNGASGAPPPPPHPTISEPTSGSIFASCLLVIGLITGWRKRQYQHREGGVLSAA
jgi:hypothetical protein